MLLTLIVTAVVAQAQYGAIEAQHGLEHGTLRSIASVESANGLYRLNVRTQDYGLFQINYKTAARYGWSLSRLYADDTYSAGAAAVVLVGLRRSYKARDGAKWVCRYNLGTKSLTGKRLEKCMLYIEKLKQAGYGQGEA